jgi:hypothetical protein
VTTALRSAANHGQQQQQQPQQQQKQLYTATSMVLN